MSRRSPRPPQLNRRLALRIARWAYGVAGWRGTLALAGLLLVALVVAVLVLRDRLPWQPEPTPAPFAQTDGVVGVFVLPEDGRDPILAEIAAAQSSITLQVYLLS